VTYSRITGTGSYLPEKLVNDETGQSFEFEILLDNPQFERIVLPFAKNLLNLFILSE